MLELHLALLDYEGDDDARDQGQCNGRDDAEVEGLSVLHARLEDGQLRERRSDSLELLSIGHCCKDRLVGVLREVRYRLVGSCIDEHVYLEVGRVGLVELVRAEAVRLSITNVLLIDDGVIVVCIGRLSSCVSG